MRSGNLYGSRAKKTGVSAKSAANIFSQSALESAVLNHSVFHLHVPAKWGACSKIVVLPYQDEPHLKGIVLPVVCRVQLEIAVLVLSYQLNTVLQRNIDVGCDGPLRI